MIKLISFLCIVIMSWRATAQDERYFRQIFSGELNKKDPNAQVKDNKSYSFIFQSPFYELDLNRDGTPEQILFVKKDSEDWIEMYSLDKKKFFAYKFDNLGFDSELFKIEMKTLGPATTILLLHYYEGVSKYINFEGTARVYAVTIDNNDLSTIKAFKGPSFFDEVKNFKGHYHKRNYDVYVEDLNKDSVKELIVKYRNSSNVFIYKGAGNWQTIRQEF